MEYDVVIVGASVSGCTAAILYGRAGLRVALLEKHRSINTHKRLCGHFLLGGAQAPLQRLGLWDELLAAGAGTGDVSIRTEYGWTDPSRAGVPPFLNVRRVTLDPILRGRAADTGGVDLLLGRTVTGLLTEGRRVTGVRARLLDGTEETHTGRLIVGADGYRSKVAALADVPERFTPNGRAFFYTYYRNVRHTLPTPAAVWWNDRDWVVLGPTDGGLIEVAVMPAKDTLPPVLTDHAGYIERYVASLPDAPDLARAERVAKVVIAPDYPLIRRHPTPAPGLALIGDAALTADPTPAPGCTWALLSGQWLADATAPALLAGDDSAAALRRYRRDHRAIEREHTFMRGDAEVPPSNRVQRLLQEAAVHDPEVSRRLALVGMQAAPTTSLLNPALAVRALLVRHRGRRRFTGRAGYAPR
ncbi:NAD(P)/FAD-dependent oxidoreductase [Nonomuraea turkmeniaca]|uniref:NAD(P)/FAD-dependent oxidoreductase n=1 Tax=Nonomuraea turkmeniaca TaxID=103838 RepID=A0A5S4FBR8_9ACTN|nr:NAD(P)/FAD-dependent oxidoreductase [Nonomuraea turkmeniaca]TMR15449.1 NAD(P)/FAD-dependent oxidoreductase [Nonomuraea turkmeniaca]